MDEVMASLNSWRQMVDDFLSKQFLENADHKVLLDAMRYSLLAGGKRIRPLLVMAFCEACGNDLTITALPAAAALEMLHCYSLIHDDLPCMDDDDFRRGKPTNHKVYGEAIATLAGDALLTASFRYLAEVDITAVQRIECIKVLSLAAGESGMVAGQTLDLLGETRSLNDTELRKLHRCKTGALIAAACKIGTIIGGGTDAQITAAEEFGYHLGLAFQIRDDILDCVGIQEELGKPIGSDIQNEKSTFVSLYGISECQELVYEETALAMEYLNAFSTTETIQRIAEILTERTK